MIFVNTKVTIVNFYKWRIHLICVTYGFLEFSRCYYEIETPTKHFQYFEKERRIFWLTFKDTTIVLAAAEIFVGASYTREVDCWYDLQAFSHNDISAAYTILNSLFAVHP